jgi:hypothetical protein
MAIDAQKQAEAEKELYEQLRNNTANLVFRRSFSPKAGTEVIHHNWYSTNGLCAKVVETRRVKGRPSMTITEWSEAPVMQSPNILT